MPLNIVCAGHLIRYPLGGHCWHHLQYLVGLKQLGHRVTFVEHYGWNRSCYDPDRADMTDDPAYGIAFLRKLLTPHGLQDDWCFLAADGAAHGLSHEELAHRCRSSDLMLNLSNMNWTPEFELCRNRVLVDTDPAFTQIGFGMGGPFDRYQTRFTFGENVHRPGCDMPTGGVTWLPTRQPVVPNLWPLTPGDPRANFTSVLNWTAYGDRVHEGRTYGQKDREFLPFMSLPRETHLPMLLAVSGSQEVKKRLADGGWQLGDPLAATLTPGNYQQFIAASRAEFCVAKHGYVSTRCGWFSDRSTAYMAMGRPVVLQDTGFSDFLPIGQGLLAWRTPAEAKAALAAVSDNYAAHGAAARAIVEQHFAADKVLTDLLQRAL